MPHHSDDPGFHGGLVIAIGPGVVSECPRDPPRGGHRLAEGSAGLEGAITALTQTTAEVRVSVMLVGLA